MNPLEDVVRMARESGNFAVLVSAIPYLQFLGVTVDSVGGELIGKMAYADSLIGNAGLPALHGGAIGALLESTDQEHVKEHLQLGLVLFRLVHAG